MNNNFKQGKKKFKYLSMQKAGSYILKSPKIYQENSINDKQMKIAVRINMQKSIIFLYTNNKYAYKEIIDTITHNNFKKIKYIGIYLKKKMQDL